MQWLWITPSSSNVSILRDLYSGRTILKTFDCSDLMMPALFGSSPTCEAKKKKKSSQSRTTKQLQYSRRQRTWADEANAFGQSALEGKAFLCPDCQQPVRCHQMRVYGPSASKKANPKRKKIEVSPPHLDATSSVRSQPLCQLAWGSLLAVQLLGQKGEEQALMGFVLSRWGWAGWNHELESRQNKTSNHDSNWEEPG